MILRRLTRHVEEQNWFAVALDFLVVVGGVGLALWAEQRLSDRAVQREVATFQSRLALERMVVYRHASERIATRRCRTERIDALAAALLKPPGAWTAQRWAVREGDNLTRRLPLPIREPHRNWPVDVWRAGQRRGLVERMPVEQAARNASIFKQAALAEALQGELLRDWSSLAPLAFDTELGQAERLRYYETLGAIDNNNDLLDLVSRQLVTSIELEGFGGHLAKEAPPDFNAAEALDSIRAEDRAKYGDCNDPVAMPAFEAEFGLASEDEAGAEPAE